jgi:hypothetical protein
MAKARIGGVTNSMEDHLLGKDNPNRPKLRLKNGSEVDATIAYVDWQMLEAVETRSPDKLAALLAIARGEEASVAPQMLADLRNGYPWFEPDGTMEPIVRNVILSAMRHTSEGSLLVFPFDIKTETDKNIFTQVQREDDDFLRRKPRGGSDHDRSR